MVAKKKVITKKKVIKKKVTKIGDASITESEQTETTLDILGKEPMLKQKDVRILRESLVWAFKRLQPQDQVKVVADLKRFSKQIESYCECPERVFIAKENKEACLDCGKRIEPKKKCDKC